jgi:hypothetical protein
LELELGLGLGSGLGLRLPLLADRGENGWADDSAA